MSERPHYVSFLALGFCLSVVLYIWTGSLLNPSSAGVVDLQNSYRLTDSFGFPGFKLNCSNKKAAQEIDVGKIFYLRMLTVVDRDVFRCSNPLINSWTPESTNVNHLIVDSHISRRIFGVLHNCYSEWRAARKDHLEVSGLSRLVHESIRCWFMRFDMSPSTPYFRQGGFLKGVGSFDKRSLYLAGVSSQGNQVVMNALNIPHSDNREEASIGSLHYLATLHGRWGTSRFKQESISSNNDPIPGARGQDKSGSASGSPSDKQQEEPEYMRRNDTGPQRFWRTRTGQLVDDLRTTDIDVSYDGKVWFHLFGPKCINELPRITLIVPQSTKHDRSGPIPSRE